MSASAYPPAHSYPAFIPTPAPEGDTSSSYIDIKTATVAQLRTAIGLQQEEVRVAANGLPRLCDLLNRRLMEGAADTDLAVVEFEDPVRLRDLHALVHTHLADVTEALRDFDYKAAIDRALTLADRAYVDHENDEDNGSGGAWLKVGLDKRHEPLIQALDARQIGRVDLLDFGFHIELRDLFSGRKKRRGGSNAAAKAMEAFALELSKPGFEFTITPYEYD